MEEQAESLANRLVEEEKRSCRERKHFEEQRMWLIAQLKSISYDEEMQPRRKVSSSQRNEDGNKSEHVEDRLLAYGRLKAERLAKAREARQKEREMEDEKNQQTVAPVSKVNGEMIPSSFQNKQEALQKRSARHKQIVEESMSGLTFHPRISAESARLARERRTNEHTEAVPIADVLFQRKAASNERLLRMREKQHTRSSTPNITSKAKGMELPFTASERLYLHAKERHAEEREMEEQLRDVVENNLELTFQPSISKRAERLQRRPGRLAHDDLYEHGVQRQRQRSASASDAPPAGDGAFRPVINRLSAHIATRLDESTAERLLRPRRAERAERVERAERAERPVRADGLDRHFRELYSDVGARAARRQRAVQEAQDLGPEYTFAPKINHKKYSHGMNALPLDERMHLWQERRNRRLAEAREKLEEQELAECNASLRHREPPTHSRSGYSRGDKSDNLTSPLMDGHYNDRNCTEEAEGTTTRSTTSSLIEHKDVFQEALRALENAERVSRYITVD